MHGHTDPDAVKRVYRAHTDAFALARRKVQSIAAPDDLAKAIRARQRSLARNIGKPREGYYRVLLAIADEERHRRGLPEVDVLTARSPKLPKPARRQKRSAPAAPEIHAEQLSLADAPAAAPSATGLIARLFARLQQPESPGAITSTA